MIFTLGGVPLPVLARARVYVCGITPYDTTHVGHAATFVWVDTLARVLEHVGIEVQVCRNVTDVDDDLVAAARQRGLSWHALATQQTFRFEEDMRKLKVRRPTFEPMSREYVTDVIFLARALLDRGVAYERGGTVWFRGAGVAEGVGLTPEEVQALLVASGGEPADRQVEHPADVAVWRRSVAGEPAWSSPWGDGRPGWHAECAAMATSVLGLGIDVQAGGHDLAFPHHAYSSAMAEAAIGAAPFARAHMHVGTVRYRGAKVAKSTGNLVFVDDLLQAWPGEVVRLYLLDRPWSQGWDFDEDALGFAATRLEDLLSRAGGLVEDEAATAAALAALAHDLDVPRALRIAEEAGGGTLRTIGKLLGVL
ncbi:MAG: cysteine--tRNA ligase [Acidimicrobiales bacterium]|nr:cysteine--tRNA ligase [Acidimicrobiales bacterium]